MQTTIAILAGGESRRMGRDKAEIVIGGEKMLTRTARIAREICPRVGVVGREKPGDWPWADVMFRPDEIAGAGPLAGLTAALEHLRADETLLLLACDLPLLTPDALKWLCETGETRWPLDHGLVTLSDGRREPLFSLYTRECLTLASRHLKSGRRSLMALIDAGEFQFAEMPPEVRNALRDADTPEEWASLTHSEEQVQ